MAWYKDLAELTMTDGSGQHWKDRHSPGSTVPVSGIYKCINCRKEVTSNAGDPFPTQNHSQHAAGVPIRWKLIVRTNTEGK